MQPRRGSLRPMTALAAFILLTLSAPAVPLKAQGPAVGHTLGASPLAGRLSDALRDLRRDALQHLAGKNSLPFDSLEKRLGEARAQLPALPEADRAALKIDIDRIADLLRKAKSLRLMPGAASDARLKALIAAVESNPNSDSIDVLNAIFGGLEQAASDPSSATQVFDRMKAGLRNNPEALVRLGDIEKDFAKEAVEFTDPQNPKIQSAKPRDLDLKAPAPRISEAPAPPPLPVAQNLKKAVTDAASPFFNLLPDARERAFVSQREQKRAALLAGARDAIAATGGDPADFQNLPAAVALLEKIQARLYRELGFEGAASTADERIARLKRLLETNATVGLFALNLSRYHVFMQQALLADAIPLNTVIEHWEIGAQADPDAKITFHMEKQDGRSYLGMLYTFKDGSTRFQGQSSDESSGLMVVNSESESRSVRTKVDFDGKGEISATDTLIINTVTGRPVRRELVDMAKKLSTITTFDDLGVALREETSSEITGAKSILDWEKGLRIEAGRDKKAVIHSIPTTKGGPVPFKTQIGSIDEEGRFIVEKVVLPDDKILLTLSPHITRVLDPEQKILGHEVRLNDLIDVPAGDERHQKSKSLAKEIIKALGFNDDKDRLSTGIAGFLFDFARNEPGAKSIRLFIDDQKRFNIIIEDKNKTSKVFIGKVMDPTTHGVPPKTHAGAFVVLGDPVSRVSMTMDKDGVPHIDPKQTRRWLEYTAEGTRLEWSEGDEKIVYSRWKLWKADEIAHHTWVTEQKWSGTRASGEWVDGVRDEYEKRVEEIEGSSSLGWLGGKISNAPILGTVLDYGGKTGKSIYTGIMAAPQWILSEVADSDMYNIEAVASYYKNPAMRALMKDEEFLTRLHPGAKETLRAEALSNRSKALEQQGISQHRAPDAYQQAMRTPVSDKEMLGALNGFGAGSYGSRLIAAGGETSGLASFAFTAGGVLTGAFENIAETTFNPVIWATFGLGKGVTALQGMAKAGTLFRGGELLLTAAKVTHFVLATTLISSWVVGGVDNLGKTFQYWDGDRQRFYEKLSDTTVDLVFAGLMYKGIKDSKAARQKALAEEAARQAALEQAALGESGKAGAAAAASAQAPAIAGEVIGQATKPAAIESAGGSGGAGGGTLGGSAPANAPAVGWKARIKSMLGLGQKALTQAQAEAARITQEAQAKLNEAALEKPQISETGAKAAETTAEAAKTEVTTAEKTAAPQAGTPAVEVKAETKAGVVEKTQTAEIKTEVVEKPSTEAPAETAVEAKVETKVETQVETKVETKVETQAETQSAGAKTEAPKQTQAPASQPSAAEKISKTAEKPKVEEASPVEKPAKAKRSPKKTKALAELEAQAPESSAVSVPEVEAARGGKRSKTHKGSSKRRANRSGAVEEKVSRAVVEETPSEAFNRIRTEKIKSNTKGLDSYNKGDKAGIEKWKERNAKLDAEGNAIAEKLTEAQLKEHMSAENQIRIREGKSPLDVDGKGSADYPAREWLKREAAKAKAAEAGPVENKPAENKPVENKPVEPQTEPKPAEVKAQEAPVEAAAAEAPKPKSLGRRLWDGVRRLLANEAELKETELVERMTTENQQRVKAGESPEPRTKSGARDFAAEEWLKRQAEGKLESQVKAAEKARAEREAKLKEEAAEKDKPKAEEEIKKAKRRPAKKTKASETPDKPEKDVKPEEVKEKKPWRERAKEKVKDFYEKRTRSPVRDYVRFPDPIIGIVPPQAKPKDPKDQLEEDVPMPEKRREPAGGGGDEDNREPDPKRQEDRERGPAGNGGGNGEREKAAGSQGGGGAGAGGGGGGAGGGPEGGGGPNSPNMGGGGGGGGGGGDAGGGGGGAAGGGGGLAGAGLNNGPLSSAEIGGDPGAFTIPPVTRGGFSGGPSYPGRSAAPRANTAPFSGGHSESPSLASRFDGSADTKAPIIAKNLPSTFGGADAGMPMAAWSPKAGAAKPGAPAPAAEQAREFPDYQPAPAANSAIMPRPESEDYSYTYLPPARDPKWMADQSGRGASPWYLAWLKLALEASAAMSVSYLMFRSDLPYLLGFSRRRRGHNA